MDFSFSPDNSSIILCLSFSLREQHRVSRGFAVFFPKWIMFQNLPLWCTRFLITVFTGLAGFRRGFDDAAPLAEAQLMVWSQKVYWRSQFPRGPCPLSWGGAPWVDRDAQLHDR